MREKLNTGVSAKFTRRENYPIYGIINETEQFLFTLCLQINPADFNTTKFDPALQMYRDRILDTLFIQWNATTWEDLRKPLYSAIATQLYAVLATGGRGIPVSTEEQAALWSRGNSTANIFVRTVEILEISKYANCMFRLETTKKKQKLFVLFVSYLVYTTQSSPLKMVIKSV